MPRQNKLAGVDIKNIPRHALGRLRIDGEHEMNNPTAKQARKIIAEEAAKRGWTVAYLNLTRGSMNLRKDGVARIDHGGATLRNNCEANLRYAVYACIEGGKRLQLGV